MSNPIQSMPTPTGEFQAHFGASPGSTDLAAECKKWENLCGELIVDRQKLREELARAQKALMRAECDNYVCPYTADEMLANAIYEPTIPELVAELAKNRES